MSHNTLKKSFCYSFVGFSFLLLGCQQTQTNKTEQLPQAREADMAVVDITDAMKPQRVSLHLNGEKYIASQQQLKKGDRLYSLSINQYGTVTGKIVLIGQFATELDIEHCKIAALTASTFELRCMDPKRDLYPLYLQLREKYGEKAVELGIDFSPLDNRPEF